MQDLARRLEKAAGYNGADVGERQSLLREAAAAIKVLSPSTPVDGVGAEPVAWPKIMYVCEYCQENNPEMCGHDRGDLYVTPGGEWLCEGCLDEVGVARVDCVSPPLLYAAPLANPEAEARLQERVDVKQILSDVEAGKRDVFVNKGCDPHGNRSDLDCPYCGGSGHKNDVKDPRAYGFEYNGEGYSATGAEARLRDELSIQTAAAREHAKARFAAEARLAQAEGGPAVTDAMVEAAHDAFYAWPADSGDWVGRMRAAIEAARRRDA